MSAVQPLPSLLALTFCLFAQQGLHSAQVTVLRRIDKPLSNLAIAGISRLRLWISSICTVVGSPFSAAYIKAVRPLASRACTVRPFGEQNPRQWAYRLCSPP